MWFRLHKPAVVRFFTFNCFPDADRTCARRWRRTSIPTKIPTFGSDPMHQGRSRSPTQAVSATMAKLIVAGYSDDPVWARYDALNAAMAEEVFGEQAAGRPVYLDLDHDALTRIAGDLSFSDKATPAEELVGIVKATLSSPDSETGTFGVHASRARWWGLQESTAPPPCVAVLAVLSLVAESMKQTEQFAGTNYYGRLLQTLDIDEAHRDTVTRSFRKETPFLWNTLNRWLEECNGRRGLPTAVAFDRLRYIGLPLSQALVREQDRAKLPMLFTQFGLQPGQRVSVQAMQELLADWLPRSPVTQSLKRLWSKPATRERISEIACAEMEAWDGQLPDEFRSAEVGRDDDLLLAAEVRSHPRRSIDLILVARHCSRGRPRRAVLHPDATAAARTAFARTRRRDAARADSGNSVGFGRAQPSCLLLGSSGCRCLARAGGERRRVRAARQAPDPAQVARRRPLVRRNTASRAAGDLLRSHRPRNGRSGAGRSAVVCAGRIWRTHQQHVAGTAHGLDCVRKRAAGADSEHGQR